MVGNAQVGPSISMMSGISRFFAPAKCASASAGTHTHTGPTHCGRQPSANDDKVDGIEIDKDGWQMLPNSLVVNAGSENNDLICIDVDGSDGEGGDWPKPGAKAAIKTAQSAPMPAEPERQGVALPEKEVKESKGDDKSTKDEAEHGGTNQSDAEDRAEKNAETNADVITTHSTNPFASFVFGSGGAPPAAQRSSSVKRHLSKLAASNKGRSKEKSNDTKSQGQQKDYKKRRKCDNNNYVPVCQLPVEQQEEIRAKWQSLGDPNEALEVRRFQVLVAARLHAQSREPTVRAAMDTLRKFFSERGDTADGGTLNAKNLSKADPKAIAMQIPSILFANVKAEHIVKAAKEVCSRFGGTVPQTQHGLKELTGIGPKLADILEFANSRKAYENTL